MNLLIKAVATCLLAIPTIHSKAMGSTEGCFAYLRLQEQALSSMADKDLDSICRHLASNHIVFDDAMSRFSAYSERVSLAFEWLSLGSLKPRALYIEGSSGVFGARGELSWLAVRLSNGDLSYSFGVATGGIPQSLKRSPKGYPDLQISPGVCDAIWTWEGKRYKHRCNVAQADGSCQDTPQSANKT